MRVARSCYSIRIRFGFCHSHFCMGNYYYYYYYVLIACDHVVSGQTWLLTYIRELFGSNLFIQTTNDHSESNSIGIKLWVFVLFHFVFRQWFRIALFFLHLLPLTSIKNTWTLFCCYFLSTAPSLSLTGFRGILLFAFLDISLCATFYNQNNCPLRVWLQLKPSSPSPLPASAAYSSCAAERKWALLTRNSLFRQHNFLMFLLFVNVQNVASVA